jgi:hypothetical protein
VFCLLLPLILVGRVEAERDDRDPASVGSALLDLRRAPEILIESAISE